MLEQVELSSFDLRYQNYRLKNAKTEKALIASILENDIVEPLKGVELIDVDTKENRILLDGFKRYRCAKKLNIGIVPYSSLGKDEAMGLIALIRMANSGSLTILEQAKLIDELKNVHKMSVSEIAKLLEKSKGWVGMRIGLIEKMSPCVTQKIFNGEFPAYSYMYTLRPFIRMNGIKKEKIDEFVGLVSSKDLSIRDIEMLAHGYFNGSDEFRQQIQSGDISLGLSSLKEGFTESTGCTQLESKMLKDLEITDRGMQRVTYRCNDNRLKSNSFYAQAHLLSGGILKQIDRFKKTLEKFYDRTGKT